MRSEDMEKVTVFALNKDREAVLTKLHERGVLQITDCKSAGIPLENTIPSEDLKTLSDGLLRVSRIVTILKIPPRKLTIPQSLFGLELIDKKTIDRKNLKTLFQKGIKLLQNGYNTKRY